MSAGSVLRGACFVLGILFVTGDRMQILTQRLSATKPLHQREPEDPSRIGTMRVALQNQRDGLLAFARVLDDKLAAIARSGSAGLSGPRHVSAASQARLVRLLARLESAACRHGAQVLRGLDRGLASHAEHATQQLAR